MHYFKVLKHGAKKTRPPNDRSGAVWGAIWRTRLEMLFRYHNWYMIQGLGVEIFRFSEIRQLHLIRPR
jgi:hypothetical protein